MARGGKVHFVRSTHTHPDDVLVVGGKSIWSDCVVTFRKIDLLCGDEASTLFAEPNIKQKDGTNHLVVAWFGDFDDHPKQLDSLSPGIRARVEADLASRLEALRPALADGELGETVAAMLNLADASSFVAVGEHAVLTNWGILPEGARGSQAAFARHTERTIGSYLPSGLSPRVPGQPWSATSGLGSAGLSPPRRAAISPAAGGPIEPDGVGYPSGRRDWRWPLVAVSLLFGALLVYTAWPGNRIYPQVLAAEPPEDLIDSSAVNQSLEERIARIKQELGKRACEADASVLGALMDDAGTSGPAEAAVHGQAASPASQLLEKLDTGTVLVLAISGNSLSSGSGFFVSPREILTNRHVIENAATVVVVSKVLKRAVPATIVAQSSDSQMDFALLRVDQAQAAGVVPLALSVKIERMDHVIAGGFPGIVMSRDQTYQDIINGNTSGVNNLEMVVTQGDVMAMPTEGRRKVITHSASISRGNSGGPLTDSCGRAVGVNTYIVSDAVDVEKLNYSLRASDAIDFLTANGVAITADEAPCNPKTTGASEPGAQQ